MDDILDRLKARLLPLPTALVAEEGKAKLRHAAVLIPIVTRPEGYTVLLTRRADHLKSHPGQVSFPGGGIEPEDETPAHGALREAYEEIGLEARFVTLKGALKAHPTGSGFFVYPVVGLVAPGFTITIDPSEVADVFEVPLSVLMDPRNHERHHLHLADQVFPDGRSFPERARERSYYAISHDSQTIWGITAGMIVNMHETLYDTELPAPPALSLATRPWFTAEATRDVMAALSAQGGAARFVGGCVRNTLLSQPVTDIDIATPEPPQRVLALLEAAGIRAIPTGLAHGTVTAVVGGQSFEITTLRRDVATDGRHAEIAFTADWAEDARRRDFTINAIYADNDGMLHDYVGGIGDLNLRRVRFIGNAAQRIAEDYLRILRFFRFSAWYGRGALDAESLAACAAGQPGLARLSAERVAHELLRLLAARNPLAALSAMRETGILAEILPEADHLEYFSRLLMIEVVLAREPDPVIRLAALTGRDGARAAALCDRLKLSNEIRERLTLLAQAGESPYPDLPGPGHHALIYRVGIEAYSDLIMLGWAERGADAVDQRWRKLYRARADWTVPVFPISGTDVLAAGIPAGPRVGRLLAELEAGWIAEDFKADRAGLLERLSRLVGRGPFPA